MPKNKPPKSEPIKTISEKPDPDTDRWYDYILKAKQEIPNRLEDAAKFLATMISFSLSIFLAISGGDSQLLKHPHFGGIKIALLIWLGALISSFLVLFPWRYHYVGNSVQSIKETHQKIIRVKRILLIASLTLFLVAFGLIISYEL